MRRARWRAPQVEICRLTARHSRRRAPIPVPIWSAPRQTAGRPRPCRQSETASSGVSPSASLRRATSCKECRCSSRSSTSSVAKDTSGHGNSNSGRYVTINKIDLEATLAMMRPSSSSVEASHQCASSNTRSRGGPEGVPINIVTSAACSCSLRTLGSAGAATRSVEIDSNSAILPSVSVDKPNFACSFANLLRDVSSGVS